MTVTRNFVGDDLCFAEEKFYIPWFADNWSRPVMKMDGDGNPSWSKTSQCCDKVCMRRMSLSMMNCSSWESL